MAMQNEITASKTEMTKAITASKEEMTNAITVSQEEMTNVITAVKDDIAAGEEETTNAIAASKQGMAAAITARKEEMTAAIAESRVKTNAAIATVKDDIAASREETNVAIAAVQNDITSVKEEISAVDVRVDEKILSVEGHVQNQITQLHKEFAEATFASAQNVCSSNVSKPVIKLSTFDRKTGWSVYRTQLEMVTNTNGWNDATSAIHLAASPRGEAANVLQTLPAEKRNSLQDLLKTFELQFGDSALPDYQRLQLKTSGSMLSTSK